MDSGAISIKITKSENEITAPVTGEKPVQTTQPGVATAQQGAVNTALISMGKQMMMNGIKEYGNITGDYATVELIDTAMGIGSDIMMIGIGGPVGVIAVVGKHTIQLASQAVTKYNNDIEIERLRERMGRVATRGSRYGD